MVCKTTYSGSNPLGTSKKPPFIYLRRLFYYSDPKRDPKMKDFNLVWRVWFVLMSLFLASIKMASEILLILGFGFLLPYSIFFVE